jgi:hypothetical protein
MQHTIPTTVNNRPGRRLARRAAALVVAATAAFGVTAAGSLDAGAWTPAPDGPLGGGWAPSLPEPSPKPLPSPRPSLPPITLPESVFQPVRPAKPLPPASDPSFVPPVDDGAGDDARDDGARPVSPLDPSRVRLLDPDSLVPDGPLCEVADCPDETEEVPGDEIPPAVESDDCLPTTPASWGAEAGTIVVSGPCEELTPDGTPEDLGYPDSEGQVGDPVGSTSTTEPEVTPVRVESATGSLAFTGSDLALPLAGAGLLGAGGVLAGISVLARRTRSGRS